MNKIVGICLIKNEDLFIENTITNIIDFCDEILILDNKSTDNTFSIVNKLGSKYKKIKIYSVENCISNHYINKYMGTDTWVFGVDGDEIFDPIGLINVRKKIKDGLFNKYHRIRASNCNVFKLDIKNPTATGYMSPPSRSTCKLYNFKHLATPFPNCERLHGAVRWHTEESFNYTDFDNDEFRYLHLVFINRSSISATMSFNKNDTDLNITQAPPGHDINFKLQEYAKGTERTVNINNFNIN